MTVNTAQTEQLVFGDVKKVADITGLSKSTLDKMRLYRPEESPPFLRIGRKVVYPLTGPRGLAQWVEQRIAQASGAAGTIKPGTTA